jgi:Family of unknown function (DUF5989)
VKGTEMLKIMKRFKSVVSLLGEFWVFMRMQKKWWLAPLVVILILMGVLIILTEGSALAPFIYAIF